MHPGILVIAAFAALFLESDSWRRTTRPSSGSRDETNPEGPSTSDNTGSPRGSEATSDAWRQNNLSADASIGDAFAADADSVDSDGFQVSIPPSEALTQLTLGICNQLVPCRRSPSRELYESCQRSIREGSDFNNFFGLTSADNFEALLQQRPEGLRVDATALNQCLRGMLSIACEEDEGEDGASTEVEAGDAGIEDFSILPLYSGEAPELHDCRNVFSRQPVTCEGAHFEDGDRTELLSRLSNALCSRMATCYPDLACEACQAGALGTNMGIHLGLSSGNLGGLAWGLQTGLYQVNNQALEQCAQEIAAANCASLSGSWDPQTPNNFADLPNWLPRSRNSCLGILSEPRITCEPTSQNPVMRLAAGICSIVGSCQTQSTCETCISGIMTLNNFGDDLGLPRTERISLQELANRVEQRRVTVNTQALQECLSSLESIRCLNAQRALRTNASGAYTRLDSVLSGRRGCRRVFSNPN